MLIARSRSCIPRSLMHSDRVMLHPSLRLITRFTQLRFLCRPPFRRAAFFGPALAHAFIASFHAIG